jgi:hypothetical protein
MHPFVIPRVVVLEAQTIEALPESPAAMVSDDRRQRGNHRRILPGLDAFAADTAMDVDAIETWVDFLEEVQRTEPRFLAKSKFPSDYQDRLDRLLEAARSEVAMEVESDDASDYRERATRLASLASSLSRLAPFLGDDAIQAKEIADRLRARSSYFEDEAKERDDDENGHEHDDSDARSDELDIRNIFIDL